MNEDRARDAADALLTGALELHATTIGRRSGRPREVVLWFAARGDTLYVLSGGREDAHWVRNMQADPRLVVRVGDRWFEAIARSIEGTDEDPVAREAIAAKYGTTGLGKWLRESLPIALDLVGERDRTFVPDSPQRHDR